MKQVQEENRFKKLLYNEVTLVLAIASVAWGAFNYFESVRHDQSDEVAQNNFALQLQDQRISGQRVTIDELTKTQQNDMKEVKNEMQGLRSEIQDLTVQTAQLKTVIEERIPIRK